MQPAQMYRIKHYRNCSCFCNTYASSRYFLAFHSISSGNSQQHFISLKKAINRRRKVKGKLAAVILLLDGLNTETFVTSTIQNAFALMRVQRIKINVWYNFRLASHSAARIPRNRCTMEIVVQVPSTFSFAPKLAILTPYLVYESWNTINNMSSQLLAAFEISEARLRFQFGTVNKVPYRPKMPQTNKHPHANCINSVL